MAATTITCIQKRMISASINNVKYCSVAFNNLYNNYSISNNVNTKNKQLATSTIAIPPTSIYYNSSKNTKFSIHNNNQYKPLLSPLKMNLKPIHLTGQRQYCTKISESNTTQHNENSTPTKAETNNNITNDATSTDNHTNNTSGTQQDVANNSSTTANTNASKSEHISTSHSKEPIRVLVSGASGNIGYALLFRIASGELFGADQPIILHLLEATDAVKRLKGIEMEVMDCAFPLVTSVVATDDLAKAFDAVNVAFLVGAHQRLPGMERGDLLVYNGGIFQAQGRALNKWANKDALKVLVIGNPSSTNAAIAAENAPNIPVSCFSALSRLDHNRGISLIASKLQCSLRDIKDLIIWGSHAHQIPDISHVTVKGKHINDLLEHEPSWYEQKLVPYITTRGAAIIANKGSSSAASAANAALQHMHDWYFGTGSSGSSCSGDRWTSMIVPSDGSYGVKKGLFFSFPVTVSKEGTVSIVKKLQLPVLCTTEIETVTKELINEKAEIQARLDQLSHK